MFVKARRGLKEAVNGRVLATTVRVSLGNTEKTERNRWGLWEERAVEFSSTVASIHPRGMEEKRETKKRPVHPAPVFPSSDGPLPLPSINSVGNFAT